MIHPLTSVPLASPLSLIPQPSLVVASIGKEATDGLLRSVTVIICFSLLEVALELNTLELTRAHPPPPPSHQHPHQTSSPIAHPFPSSSVSKPLPSLLAPTPSQPHKAPKLKHDYALQRCRFACELCWEVCRRATS